MADNDGRTAVEWAVVATGCVTSKADIVVLKTDGGERIPIILGIYKDVDKAASMARRMASKIGKVIGFDDAGLSRGTPIMGVQPVIVPFREKRQTPVAQPSANSKEAVATAPANRRKGQKV